jgi:hypothetical protein
MAYSGVFATAGLLICLPLVCLVVVRFKDLRMRRVLGILEWLAINATGRDDRSMPVANLETARVWHDAQWIFSSRMPTYFRLVWNAQLRDLYWANRFGSELQRLSLFPLRQLRQDEELMWHREEAVSVHIRDFLILADTLLRKKQRGERGEYGER